MSSTALTEKDMRNLALAWQCFVGGEPVIDYTKFARLAGYTEGSARTTFGTLRRKIKALGENNDANNNNGAAAEKTNNGDTKGGIADPKVKLDTPQLAGKKRARKATDNGEGEGASPEKKPRRPRQSKAQKEAAKVVEEEMEGDDDGIEEKFFPPGLVGIKEEDEGEVVDDEADFATA